MDGFQTAWVIRHRIGENRLSGDRTLDRDRKLGSPRSRRIENMLQKKRTNLPWGNRLNATTKTSSFRSSWLIANPDLQAFPKREVAEIDTAWLYGAGAILKAKPGGPFKGRAASVLIWSMSG